MGKIQAKTWQNHGDVKKAKQLTFTPELKQVVRFLEEYEQMAMIGDRSRMIPCP
jgi:hypothetical protein